PLHTPQPHVVGCSYEKKKLGAGVGVWGYKSPLFFPLTFWPLATICGIGLNLNQTAKQFAESGLEQAGSLALFTGRQHDCEEVARCLIRHLDDEYDRLCQGDVHTLEACWKWRLGLLGKSVVAECPDAEYRGRLHEVGWDGVLIETRAGLVRLVPESLRHLRQSNEPEGYATERAGRVVDGMAAALPSLTLPAHPPPPASAPRLRAFTLHLPSPPRTPP